MHVFDVLESHFKRKSRAPLVEMGEGEMVSIQGLRRWLRGREGLLLSSGEQGSVPSMWYSSFGRSGTLLCSPQIPAHSCIHTYGYTNKSKINLKEYVQLIDNAPK